MFHLPDAEIDVAHAGAGEGLRVVCLIELVAIESDGQMAYTFHHQVELLAHRPNDHYGDIGSLVEGINSRLAELEKPYHGIRMLPLFYTVEKEEVMSREEAAGVQSWIARMKLREDGLRNFRRLLDGMSIEGSVSEVTFTGFSPQEREAFMRRYGAGRVIDI